MRSSHGINANLTMSYHEHVGTVTPAFHQHRTFRLELIRVLGLRLGFPLLLAVSSAFRGCRHGSPWSNTCPQLRYTSPCSRHVCLHQLRHVPKCG